MSVGIDHFVMSLYEFFGRKMKIYKIVIIIAGLFVLQGCDSQETKVKKLLKCGLAVNEIGNSTGTRKLRKKRCHGYIWPLTTAY